METNPWKPWKGTILGPWRVRPLRLLASWSIEWKPQDLWVGAFWRKTKFDRHTGYDIWVCLIPCLPIHVWWYQRDGWTSLEHLGKEPADGA